MAHFLSSCSFVNKIQVYDLCKTLHFARIHILYSVQTFSELPSYKRTSSSSKVPLLAFPSLLVDGLRHAFVRFSLAFALLSLTPLLTFMCVGVSFWAVQR